MENKTFERLAILLMSAILLALLFCAYLLARMPCKGVSEAQGVVKIQPY